MYVKGRYHRLGIRSVDVAIFQRDLLVTGRLIILLP